MINRRRLASLSEAHRTSKDSFATPWGRGKKFRFGTHYFVRRVTAPAGLWRSTAPVPLMIVGSGDAPTILVTRWVGIISAARRGISTRGSSADGSSTDAYRYPTGYGCTTVNATAIDTTTIGSTAIGSTAMNAAVVSTSAINASATTASISEGVS